MDENSFNNIYGDKAGLLQRRNGLCAVALLVGALSFLYSTEETGDIRKILKSTPAGRDKLFWTKYTVAVIVTLLVFLQIYGGEWMEAKELIGEAFFHAPARSYAALKSYDMRICSYLVWMYFTKVIAFLGIANFSVFFCERGTGFPKAFLYNLIVLIIPAMVYTYAASSSTWITPLSLLTDRNPMLTPAWIYLWIWFGVSLIMLWLAKRHWCRWR